MKSKPIIIFILAAFIAGAILLAYIEYNSFKNISSLIKGNEKLTDEFKMREQLHELQRNIITVESKVRGIVNTNDSSYLEGLQKNISQARASLAQLQKITDDDSTAIYIDEIDNLVQKKLLFSNEILETFYRSGKAKAAILVANQYDKALTDSIAATAHNIDNTRKQHLNVAISAIDESGRKAQQFSLALVVLAVLCGAGLFWYVINIIRKQISLIRQLDTSQKMVKETLLIKEKFMANMSHEIRTPMNAIIGFTNLLQRKNLDNESEEYVQTIQKSGENLLAIVNDILDLSKIEAGMMRIESAPFSMRGLLHSVEVMLSPKAAEKQLHLMAQVNENVPDALEGDAVRLTQILVNLIGNAIKFTDEGSIKISITNQGVSEDIINTGITIADTGIGIEKEKLPHIFDRFRQADDSVTRKYGGTGLGLSIVHELILLQHGSIEAESERGAGTTFKIRLPYKISSGQADTKKWMADDSLANPDFENKNVLVAEDNEINQSLIKHLFKSWQLNFDVAANGKIAIEKIKAKKYDLILMDIQMPEMDGYTATQEIRHTLKLNIPIIAMTAHALSGEREKCLSYGMNEYISKPIKEEQLHRLIARFTHVATGGGSQKIIAEDTQAGPYQCINLQYMKEISSGNTEYEKTVTALFIESIPGDLDVLKKAWEEKNIKELRYMAHNMKSTVSIMGLYETLQPYLDTMEYSDLDQDTFNVNWQQINLICNNAVSEAQSFLNSL